MCEINQYYFILGPYNKTLSYLGLHSHGKDTTKFIELCLFKKTCSYVVSIDQGRIQRLFGHSGFYWESDKT